MVNSSYVMLMCAQCAQFVHYLMTYCWALIAFTYVRRAFVHMTIHRIHSDRRGSRPNTQIHECVNCNSVSSARRGHFDCITRVTYLFTRTDVRIKVFIFFNNPKRLLKVEMPWFFYSFYECNHFKPFSAILYNVFQIKLARVWHDINKYISNKICCVTLRFMDQDLKMF